MIHYLLPTDFQGYGHPVSMAIKISREEWHKSNVKVNPKRYLAVISGSYLYVLCKHSPVADQGTDGIKYMASHLTEIYANVV